MKTLIVTFLLSIFILSSVVQAQTANTVQVVPGLSIVKTDTVKVSIKLSDINFKYLIDSLSVIKAKYLVLKAELPPKGSSIFSWLWWVFLILCAVYQLAVTIIPTARNIGLLHMVSNIFGAIAKLFNGVGNAAKLSDGTVGVFKSTPTPAPPTKTS